MKSHVFFNKNVWITGLLFSILVSTGCRPRSKNSELDEFIRTNTVAPSSMLGTPVVGDTPLTSNRNLEGWTPNESSLDADSTLIISRPQYVVAFNTKENIPKWTSWQIVADDIGEIPRSEDFQADSILNDFIVAKKLGLGITPDDYTNTCFDRGHQSPAKDRSNSAKNNEATFFMSNMAPQTAFLNRGIWGKFEAYTRTLVENDKKRIQVIAGPILKDGREKIGRNLDISIPEKFFKIVVVYPNAKSKTPEGYLAVIMPNVTSDGLDPVAYKKENCAEVTGARTGSLAKDDWTPYAVSLAEVQKQTKMNFKELKDLPQL